MVIFWIIGGLVFWFGCGVLQCGISLAYWLREFPGRSRESAEHSYRFGISNSWLGPIALGVALVETGFAKHGLMFRIPKDLP